MRMRMWTVVGVVLACGFGASPVHAEAKQLLGTVRATGAVEAGLPGGPWRPLTGGAVVEGMRLRTGADGVAVVQLSDGDVLGLAESSSCELPGAGQTHVRVLQGRLAVRLRAESALVVDAAESSVRPPATTPVSTSQREALVTLDQGTVLVRPYRGSFEVATAADGSAVQVAPGQQATLAPQAKTPIVVAADTTGAPGKEKAASHKAEEGGGVLAALGISPAVAEAIGGGAVVVGGAVGGAAAAGAFSSGGGDSSNSGGGAQGSPFRPVRH